MKRLFKNARVIDPEAARDFDGAVIVENGAIAEVIEGKAPSGSFDDEVDCKGQFLAPGIIDIGVKICEPGERHKESFSSAGRAAACGGVTTMVIRPDTEPAVDSPESLEFVKRRAAEDVQVRLYPMAALTRGREGREMAEIGFLQDAGAVAFTDCDHVTKDIKVFSRCLSYAQSLGALVIAHAQEPQLSKGAAATSGALATKLGLPAASPMAERLQLERDVALMEMTGARLHVDQISTRAGLSVLRRAKERGLPITAGASMHHLTLNEHDISGYATYFKVKPPLRAEDDRVALVEAVADGLIDVVSSMHTPQDEESKRLPFDLAASGAIGLETLLPAMMPLVLNGDVTMGALWATLSSKPAQLLGLEQGRMAKDAPADLVQFDAEKPFVLERQALQSKSKNTPFDGRRMQGRVSRTIVAGRDIYAG